MLTDNIVFEYDAQARELWSDNGMFAINAGKDYLSYLLLFDLPMLQPFNEQIAGLRAPVVNVSECALAGSDVWVGGFGSFDFNIYDTDLDGNLLDHSKLTYTIYNDDDPIVIDGKTDLPFDFDLDGEPLWSSATNQGREVAYYFLDKTINSHVLSVQLKYTDGQGHTYTSARIGYDYATGQQVDVSGEAGIRSADALTEPNARVYDLQGRRLTNHSQTRQQMVIVRQGDGQIVKMIK